MKAKMPDKIAEAAEYQCQICDASFNFTSGKLRCPDCGNSYRPDLVPIYMENNEQEDQLQSINDFGQGD